MKINNVDLILNTIDNGIIIVDNNLNVLLWNMWLEIRTTISKDNIISKNLLDFYPNINTKILKRKINTALVLKTPTFYNSENNKPLLLIKQSKITNKTFSSMQENITIVPYDIEKKLVCIYVYDDTRLLEQNYKQKQLTKKLRKEILESSEKDKKLIEQTQLAIVGEMIGNIAHNWRQPLSTISTAASGLSMKSEFGLLKHEEIEKYKDIIINATTSLSNTIDIFAKFVNHSLDIEMLNIDCIITETLQVLEGIFIDQNIEVKKDLEKNLFLNASSSELSQIFLNILTNAKDAFERIKSKNGLIIIKTYSEKDKIIIEIIDTAGGIPEEIKSKIFEPYFTTKHQIQGTGLGLHIVYRLVYQVMHGSIEVNTITTNHNNIDLVGTVFKIILPTNRTDANE